MVTKTILIEAPNGLHARPAGELVKCVKSFPGTTVTLATAAKKANAASMLGILSLGLKAGTELAISAEGPQESEAAEAVATLISSITE